MLNHTSKRRNFSYSTQDVTVNQGQSAFISENVTCELDGGVASTDTDVFEVLTEVKAVSPAPAH